MDQAIVAQRRDERWTVKGAASCDTGAKMALVSVAGAMIPGSRRARATELKMSPLRTAEAAVLAFDADAILF